MSQQRKTFYRRFELGIHRETALLTTSGGCFQGYLLTHMIWAVAVKGFVDDWTAYIETPNMKTLGNQKAIITNGIKVSEETAKAMFPEWADQFTYRR